MGTYIDRAYSAKTDDRPEFQRMVQDSARKIFDAVLVWKLDRFARNRYDAVYYKRQLEKNGVHLVSVMEPISDGPEGIMIESLLIGMASIIQRSWLSRWPAGNARTPLSASIMVG